MISFHKIVMQNSLGMEFTVDHAYEVELDGRPMGDVDKAEWDGPGWRAFDLDGKMIGREKTRKAAAELLL